MRPGHVIAERFEVERVAGAGGMGTVYRARDRVTGLPVAVKVLLGQADSVRFTREGRILEGVQHPAVVRYVARGVMADGAPYLAMEWLEGEELVGRLSRGRLSVGETVVLGRRVAAALQEVHERGVVHRDLKPSNLFLGGGRVEEVKLLDFGIALPGDPSREITRAGTSIGTPGYMAPEQARGEADVDARADLFSLGCVLFQCLAGQPAFLGNHVIALLAKVLLEEAPRVTSLRPETPAALADLIEQMMRKPARERPASAARVLAALEALGDPEALDRRGVTSAEVVEAPALSSQLTTGEQRLLSVILIAAPEATVARDADGADSADAAAAASDAAGAAATVGVAAVRFEGSTLLGVASAHGAALDHLVDGTSVLTLGGAGAATDRAAVSARCALAVRALAPGVPVVLAMGRGRAGERAPVGEVIERAAHLLRQRRGADADPAIGIDALTAGLLGERFEVRRGGAGRAPAEAPVLSLVRELPQLGAETRLFLGRATACVGRDRELASLEDEIDAAVSEPSARAVLVTGEAGVGKSRLRHELVQRLRAKEEAPEIWIARGDPLSAGAPFGLLGQVLQGAAGLSGGEAVESRRDKLLGRVGRNLGAEGQRVAEYLGELCGTPFPDDDNLQLRAARADLVLMGDQMVRAWVDFVDAECRARPVVLILEDLHWGDLPTVQYVDAALRLLPERPFVVLALARPEVEKLYPGLWGKRSLVQIHLGGLARRAAAQLAREVLGDGADAATLERLWTQSAGNVFFLEELLRATVEGRGADAPLTVLAMVQARLEGLDAEARRVLRAGSVFGQRFWRGGAEALVGAAAVDAALAALVDDEMITRARETRFSGEHEYAFRHALVREAAYAMLTDEDRGVGHRLAGAWLEGAGEGAASVLAEHFEKGELRERAAVWYRRAAEHAFEGNDLVLALSWAERAIGCAEAGSAEVGWVGEMSLLQARAHLWRGQNREGMRCGLTAMEKLPAGSAAWYEAIAEVAVGSARTGELAQLGACSELLLATEPAAEDGESSRDGLSASCATSLARTARLGFFTGQSVTGERLLHRSRSVARRCPGNPKVIAEVELAESILALLKGDLSTNLRLAESARAGFELAGDRRNACQQVSNVGYAYLQLGVHDAAERASRTALVEAERLGAVSLQATAKLNVGIAAALQGRLAEGAALAEEVLALARDHGDRRLESFGRIYLGRMALLGGELERAARESLRVVEDPAALPSLRALGFALLSAAQLAQGSALEALETARQAMAILTSLGEVEEGDALIRVTHVEALMATGDTAGAQAAIRAARDLLRAQAAKIADLELRRSYLAAVPENARILALASELVGDGGSG